MSVWRKKLSTQSSKEEGNRPVLSRPPRRTYNKMTSAQFQIQVSQMVAAKSFV